MVELILFGISLGLSAALLPGPLQAFLMATALQHGWRRALYVVPSPLIVDAPVILVVVFVLGQLPDAFLQIIRLVGGLVLLWIAWGAYQQWRTGTGFSTKSETVYAHPRRILLTAVALNAISPGPYLFWSTINGPTLIDALAQSPWHGLAFVAAFYGTFLGGLVLLAWFIGRVGALNPALTQALLLLIIVLLVWFGTSLMAEALGIVPLQRVLVVGAFTLLAAGWAWRRLQLSNPPQIGS